jgi:hypothetical protein
LEISDFENLAFGFCFGASREIIADALVLEPA